MASNRGISAKCTFVEILLSGCQDVSFHELAWYFMINRFRAATNVVNMSLQDDGPIPENHQLSASPVSAGGFWGLSPPKQSSKPPKHSQQ